MNRVKKFVNLINKRDNLIEKHCNGECWAELCNYPEERDWYCKNILPIDDEIVKVANGIIAKFSIPCPQQKNIREVYANNWLNRLFEKYSKEEANEK